MSFTRLFVGNVPSGTTEAELSNEFGFYGTVRSVELKTKNDTEVFAFVNIDIDGKLVDKCELLNLIRNNSSKSIKSHLNFQAFANFHSKNSKETFSMSLGQRNRSSIVSNVNVKNRCKFNSRRAHHHTIAAIINKKLTNLCP